VTIKTDYSRFHIHDELTAPADSAPILEAASRVGPVAKLIGVLAEAPAALRALARARHELRRGHLPRRTRERIALAVAERRGDTYSLARRARAARDAGLGLDEITRARSFQSADPREQALLSFLEHLLSSEERPSAHWLEEAREAGWSDAQILEAIAHASLNDFESLVANAAALPQDPTDPKILPEAAPATG
jgi:alkylhydroperoxidase family enzyme